MKQLCQRLRDGAMEVLDVALPLGGPGMVVVQNHFSLISAGTEGGTVNAARKSLIGKAKERPEQLRQVIDSLKQQGFVQTYRAVSKKLDSYSSLGYSAAGVVIEVGSQVRGISVGDRVACAGQGYASHAEVVAVPENLCVKLPASADLSMAAYNTLGAIALQGVRQADLRLGETCVVIGLGLLGQLTSLILKASGVKVIGLDIDPDAVDIARKHCTDAAYEMSDPLIVDAVHHATSGINTDAVIITAATSSTQPINLAGRLLRKRGTVVVVGAVPTGFDRDPDYYRKELVLKMSCSYGPGRYDIGYEEKGFDYPPGYVRWTENRNMQAFQDLILSGKINLGYMTTHRFALEQAPAAYDLILNRSEKFLGILLEYDASKVHSRERIELRALPARPGGSATSIGFVGAGSYAMSHLLPNLPRDGSVVLTGVATASGTSSRSVAEKFGFARAYSSAQQLIDDPDTGTVFIATRHDSHAEYVRQSLEAGKNVFVEKPLCLNREEMDGILEAWQKHKPLLMVGFNRRFSPLTQVIKDTMGDGPMSMLYRINAGAIPRESWIQDRDFGGGRIIGEVCHFIDLLTHLNGSPPVNVNAYGLEDPANLEDTVSINLRFGNGSIGAICYFSNGPKALPKEYLEVYKGGVAARLMDFREVEILGGRKKVTKKLASQDKGQKAMVGALTKSLVTGATSPIPFEHLFTVASASFAVVDSLREGKAIANDILRAIDVGVDPR
jgi:predicted dehydrogenase/threonine dehydrogenase-like Zn-dependent dehydrogenase